MNNKILLWAALLLGGFVLLRRQSSNASGVSVPIGLGNFAGTGASDAAYWNGIRDG